MALVEPFGEFLHQLAQHLVLLDRLLGQELLQRRGRPLRLLARDDKALHGVDGSSNLKSRKMRSQTVISRARPSSLPRRARRCAAARRPEQHLDAVGGERLLVLPDDLPSELLRIWNRSSTFRSWQITRTGNRPMNSGSKPNSRKSRVSTRSSTRSSETSAAPQR